jgi:ketosteroid isomerase-like protein
MKAAAPPPTAALDPAPPPSLPLGLDQEDHRIRLDTERLTRQWADAWAKKDVARYISFYSPDYSSPPEMPRDSWIEGRRRRILQAQELMIQITQVEVIHEGDEVSVRFQQHYRATRMNSIATKILRWRRLGEHWRIVDERILSELYP